MQERSFRKARRSHQPLVHPLPSAALWPSAGPGCGGDFGSPKTQIQRELARGTPTYESAHELELQGLMHRSSGLSAHRPKGKFALNMRFKPQRETAMNPLSERGKESARNERMIASLQDRTGAPLKVVRGLFAQEFSRLELGAKVRSYLSVLTASKVRAMLRREGAGS
jgi:hypothetical protein